MLLLEQQYQLFASKINIERDIKLPIERLYLLLTITELAMHVPSNLEAKRCISFISNSLYMDMPMAICFHSRSVRLLLFQNVIYII